MKLVTESYKNASVTYASIAHEHSCALIISTDFTRDDDAHSLGKGITMGKVSLIVAVILLAHLGATSAEAGKIGAGAVEISARGGFQHDSYSFDGNGAGSSTNVELIGGINYSVSDLVAVGGGLRFQNTSIDPDGSASASASALGFEADVVFNFQTSGSVIPFVGGGVGLMTWSGDGYDGAENTLVLPSVFAGVRLPVMDAASFNISAGYTHQVNAGGVEDLDANSFGVSFGFSIFPKGLSPRG